MTEKKKPVEGKVTGMNKKVARPKTASSAAAPADLKSSKPSKKATMAAASAPKATEGAEPARQVTKAARSAANVSGREKKATVALEPEPSRGPNSARVITAQERWRMISENAYYRAERRGFLGGNPAEDWATAEAETDAELVRTNTVVKP